jgi:hypothetical protein
MTKQEEYLLAVTGVFKHSLRILEDRSRKYAPVEFPFNNFEEAALVGDVDAVAGIMTRFGDKLGRIKRSIRQWRSTEEPENWVDETLKDSVVDAINYLATIYIYMESGGGSKLPELLVDLGEKPPPPPPQQVLPFEPNQTDAPKKNWFKEKFTPMIQ